MKVQSELKALYYNASRRSFTFTLVLWLVLLLLVFTGLGVFRLYFDFELMSGENQSGQLFSLKIRGGQSFNLFESEPFGRVFWFSQLALLALTILMPMFRLIGGSFLALLSVVGLSALHLKFDDPVPTIPLEFDLLIVGVLFAVYVLLNYIGEVRDRKRVSQLLSQYIPAELANEYRKDPQVFALRGEERNISVLFCDVVGFSAISEQLEPQQLAQWLNLFFTHVSRIVVRYRGSIDKYMGDSVMAVWGAPARSESHAYDALCAAMDIQSEIDSLNRKCLEYNLPTITMGIGISTGQAMVGPLGSEYRMDYTVVGDTVNVAQRLEEQTRKYQVAIIVSDKTAEALPDMLFRELDTVTVKGRKQQVTMFEPLGAEEQVNDIVLNWLNLHQKAMKASKAGQWDLAFELFSQLREDWGPVGMYDLYLRGIEQARKL
jgi:adenylate cyclase